MPQNQVIDIFDTAGIKKPEISILSKVDWFVKTIYS